MRIITTARIGSVSIVFLLAVLSIAVAPASAITRGSGDFFTYSITMSVEGFNATGSITNSFQGIDSLSAKGQSYDVNVMSVDGSVTVSILSGSVTATLGGRIYETQDGLGIVKDDAIIWLNASFGIGSFQIVNRTEIETMSMYSPPLMSAFTPSAAEPGDSWTETIEVSTTTTTWADGVMQGSPTNDTESLTVSYVAASSVESVNTPAGTFKTLKITATESSGDYVVYWWSSVVGNFVKQLEFSVDGTLPNLSMILTDYNHTASTSSTLIIGIGLGVAVIAVIVLVVVLKMRRRPGQPVPSEPGMPVSQPSAPSPQGPPPPGSKPFVRAP